jgi:D-xylose transport system permease protein
MDILKTSETQPVKARSALMEDILTRLKSNFQTYAIILALGALWILFTILTNGAYMGPQNISNLFRQMTVTSFLAIGMVFVIVTGNIDLSVGRLAGFVSVVVAYFQANIWFRQIPDQPFLSAVLSVLIGLGVGLLWGVLQGYIIAFLGVPSFIVTLGSMFILSGAILLVTQGRTIPANQPVFSDIAQGYLPQTLGWAIGLIVLVALLMGLFNKIRRKRKYGLQPPNIGVELAGVIITSALVFGYIYWVNEYRGIQTPVFLLALTALVMSHLANNTRFGRYAYAIGGNREAARLSGVNIQRSIFLVFALMGLLCGIAGVVLASYVGYGTIAAGQGYELDAIASAILGGTSTLGGVGTISGALIGALIMSSLTTGLQMLNVAPAWQYVVKGAVLVLAVYADVYFKRSRQ